MRATATRPNDLALLRMTMRPWATWLTWRKYESSRAALPRRMIQARLEGGAFGAAAVFDERSVAGAFTCSRWFLHWLTQRRQSFTNACGETICPAEVLTQ